ncbi:hypothetical protein HY991_05400 [Candidatus Micrarchaeota archaeon]|nr:hypothetical protein [Candidatus Micrarchaeota archaeon]
MVFKLKLAYILLSLLALAFCIVGYSDVSLTVIAEIKEDGTASVSEAAYISLNTKEEIEAFDLNIRFAEDILSNWSRFSPGGNIKFHFSNGAQPANVHISPKRDYTIGYSIGLVNFTYDIRSPAVNISKSGRVTHYTFNGRILGFEGVIPKGTKFTLIFPKDSVIVRSYPEPTEAKENALTWTGQVKASRWEVVAAKEKSLGEEVGEFFYEFYSEMLSLIPLILVSLFAFFLVFKLTRPKPK